ncbi:peptidase S41 [Marinicauda salina]|uniref:Peptidase S41 n=1 Tax=Marinicauda salina TaxID=2135793 RepID=A0A2U2BWY4_9PROT|nr:S41 family peptidase [Marinicauda salina]PWE18533.1 peptidase S41 [Marinicauda salina]
MRLQILASAVVFGIGAAALALSAEGEQNSREETFRQLELFGDVLSRIESDYVTDPDKAELIESAIDGMLGALDPHSSYLSPDDFRDMQVSTRGEYGGIGIEVTIRDDLITIISPIAETPGERAGLESGDRIVAVDGESMLGASMDDAVERMRGPAGEPVTLTIAREGSEPFDVTIVRDIIEVRSVVWRMEEDTTPYLRITTFNEHTTDAVVEAIADLEASYGADLPGLILDLRSNPGGLLDQSVSVADLFLDGGEVVSTRGRDPRETRRYNARPGDMLEGAPIVVLINPGTASASEIVAGALQDRERATVVGLTSFGKGSMQTVIPLRGGRDGALRLTTARYYTPAGRSIQATGLDPDIAIASRRIDPEAPSRFTEADLRNALGNENGDERHEIDAEAVEEPPEDWEEGEDYQLFRAREVLASMMEVEQARLDQ